MYVMYWASGTARNASRCIGCDLSRGNMHERGHFGGNLGGPPGAQRPGVTRVCSTKKLQRLGAANSGVSPIPCLISSRI